MSYISDLIMTRRTMADLTRTELARAVGVHYKRIWEWEEEIHAPRTEMLDQIMQILDRRIATTLRRTAGDDRGQG